MNDLAAIRRHLQDKQIEHLQTWAKGGPDARWHAGKAEGLSLAISLLDEALAVDHAEVAAVNEIAHTATYAAARQAAGDAMRNTGGSAA